MKEIYIVLTYTGTLLSRIIKFYTKRKYAHVSIALDNKLEKMYSFGRLNPYNAVIGGFVKEGINIGTFKRFKNTEAMIYSINVTQEQYEKICKEIQRFIKNKKEYKFNILGMFLVMFNKKLNRDKCFYCAEFVKYIIEKAHLNIQLPEIIKPDDFKNISNAKLIYEGKLRNFNIANNTVT